MDGAVTKRGPSRGNVSTFADLQRLHHDGARLTGLGDDVVEPLVRDDGEPVHGGKFVIAPLGHPPAKRQAQARAPRSAR